MKKLYFIFLFVLMGLTKSWGQTYATSATSATWRVDNLLGVWGTPYANTAYATISSLNNTTDSDTSNFATITASSTNLLVGGSRGYSTIKFNFTNQITANKTAYIRIAQPTASGIGLDLLGIIGQLTNLLSDSILYGKTYATTSTSTPISNTTSSLAKDVSGNLYLAVTSPSAFQSVELYLDYSTKLLAINLGATLSMNVYYAAVDYPNNNCGNASFTDLGVVTGLSVGVSSAVASPENALQSNGNSYSILGAGLGSIIGVGNSISQSFYFPQTSISGRQVKLDIQLPQNLLTLSLLQNITLQAYNGTTAVGTAIPLSSAIRLDLLGLFANPGMHSIYFTPTGTFNRITISLNSGINVSLGSGLYIYGIHSVPPKPTLSLSRSNVYSGQSLAAPLSVTNPGSATINWYGPSPNNSSIGTGASYNFTYPFNQSDTIYAVATDPGCTIPSDSAKFFINVLSATAPTTAFTITPNQGSSRPTLTLQTSGDYTGLNTPNFAYTYVSGFTSTGLSLNSDGSISGNPIIKGNFTLQASAQDNANNLSAGVKSFAIAVPFALPVTYTQELTASIANNTVLLAWQTGNEINNAYFDIQRSTDAKSWSSIGNVKSFFADGNGNGHNYSYTDNNVVSGTNYYRLVQYDLDGQSEIGKVVSINTNAASNILTYPNPANTFFKIKNSPIGSNYKLVNTAGQNVKFGTITNTEQDVNIADLASGLYFLEISNSGNIISKSKILKK